MRQIKEVNKAIRNAYTMEKLVTEVDESGFLIVKGTYKEFGKILFSNKTINNLLGYERKFLVSRMINCLMPDIISESHHKFWEKFNEFGVPSFIERNQHLFVKRKDGYITPVLVYVKFHYDKAFGHVFIAIIN